MRIVHLSDWHWKVTPLPEADLYICTGDMLPNFTFPIDVFTERVRQKAAQRRLVRDMGGFQKYLGSPKAPLVCVRGNHDFVDLAPMFDGCDVQELKDNEVLTVLGLRITGHRGVPTINGQWQDETPRADLYDRWHRMVTDADLYLTHYAPEGILDGVYSTHYGLGGVENWFNYQVTTPHPVHLFGHIHECGGLSIQLGNVLYSNAATGFNLLEGDPLKGWKDVSPS